MIYGGKVTWLFDPRFRYVVVDRFYFNSAWDIPHYVTINLYHQKFGNQIYHETLAISLPKTSALPIALWKPHLGEFCLRSESQWQSKFSYLDLRRKVICYCADLPNLNVPPGWDLNIVRCYIIGGDQCFIHHYCTSVTWMIPHEKDQIKLWKVGYHPGLNPGRPPVF